MRYDIPKIMACPLQKLYDRGQTMISKVLLAYVSYDNYCVYEIHLTFQKTIADLHAYLLMP